MRNCYCLLTILRLKHIHDFGGGFGDRGTRTENALTACIKEELIVVRRDNATGNHHDLASALRFQFLNEFGNQGLVTGASANILTPHVGDANTNIPEFKAFLCNITKA